MLPSFARKWADWNCHHYKYFRRDSTITCEINLAALILPWDTRKGYMIAWIPFHTSFPRLNGSIHNYCSYQERQISGFPYFRWQIHGRFARQGTHLWWDVVVIVIISMSHGWLVLICQPGWKQLYSGCPPHYHLLKKKRKNDLCQGDTFKKSSQNDKNSING